MCPHDEVDAVGAAAFAAGRSETDGAEDAEDAEDAVQETYLRPSSRPSNGCRRASAVLILREVLDWSAAAVAAVAQR